MFYSLVVVIFLVVSALLGIGVGTFLGGASHSLLSNVGWTAWGASTIVTIADASLLILVLLNEGRSDFLMLNASDHNQAVSVAPLAVTAWWTVGHLMIFAGLLPAFLIFGWDPLHLVWIVPVSVPLSIGIGTTVLRPFWKWQAKEKNPLSAAFGTSGILLFATAWVMLLLELYMVGAIVGLFSIVCLWCGIRFVESKVGRIRFTGKTIEYHDNRQKESEGEYVNGEQEGLWTSWHENGQKESEGKYVNGKKEGTWVMWHDNGQKESEGKFVNGEQDGLWVEWHRNGQKKYEENYVNGERYGSWVWWHDNGQKDQEGKFVNGVREGSWVVWHDNGQKAYERKYVNGEIDGIMVDWHDNGQKATEQYFVDGKKHGLYTEWDRSGIKTVEILYKYGNEVKR